MKKIVAMLLALCMMVTAFAGCGTSSSNAEGSSAAKQESAQTAAASGNAEENAAPAETTDFKWNGQKEVWSILPTTGAEGLVMINDAMASTM